MPIKVQSFIHRVEVDEPLQETTRGAADFLEESSDQLRAVLKQMRNDPGEKKDTGPDLNNLSRMKTAEIQRLLLQKGIRFFYADTEAEVRLPRSGRDPVEAAKRVLVVALDDGTLSPRLVGSFDVDEGEQPEGIVLAPGGGLFIVSELRVICWLNFHRHSSA